jgi:hypothetical protein
MTDSLRNDLADGDTQRTTLVDMAADNLVAVWLKLKAPQEYRSTRYHQGYMVEVTVRETPKPVTDEDDRIAD